VAHAADEHNRHLKLISETEAKLVALDAKVEELDKIKIAAEEAYSVAHEKAQERIDAEKGAKYGHFCSNLPLCVCGMCG